MAVLNIIAFIIVMIGSLNWGLVGIFNFNLVEAVFGAGRTVGSIIVYCLVLASILWLIFAAIYQKRKIVFCPRQDGILKSNDYRLQKR